MKQQKMKQQYKVFAASKGWEFFMNELEFE